MLSATRIAVRSLLRSPGFTATAVSTIAVAIGVNAAIFSILDAVVLSPLPYRAPTELVAVWELMESDPVRPVRASAGAFVAWRQETKALSKIAAFGGIRLTLTGYGEPVALDGSRVDDAYFDLLGIPPRLGRSFRRDDTIRGAAPVVLLSEGAWAGRFGSDPGIVGRKILLDGVPREVIGVMPTAFLPTGASATGTMDFRSNSSIWIPAELGDPAPRNSRSHVLGVIGRLSFGSDADTAQREIAALEGRLRRDGGEKTVGARLRPLDDEAAGDVRPALLLLWGAVLFVLLVACVNVTNLHFARSESRRREMAIRAALGGSRAALVRPLLVESLAMGLAGGALGIVLAGWALPLLLRLTPAGVPRLADVRLSATTIAFSLLLSVAAAALFGLGPALHMTRRGIEDDLKEATRAGSGSRRTRRALGILVVAEIAVASLLVVGAGLLTRSFRRLTDVDLGFRADRLLIVPVSLPKTYDRWEKVAAFHDALLENLRRERGATSVALAYNHPLEAQWSENPEILGRALPAPGASERTYWFRSVSDGYFSTIGVPLREGRDFDSKDDGRHPGVAIVNEAFARAEFPGTSPIGKRLRSSNSFWGPGLPEEFEIVGVAADVRFLGPSRKAEPAYYLPARQFPISDMKLLVRTSGDPLALLGAVRAAVRRIDPAQPVGEPMTIAALSDAAVAQPRFAMRLMVGFGAAALGLAALGIYGLLSFVVTLRTREIGVRMALGARASQVVRMMLAEVAPLAAAGAAFGVAAALAGGPLLRGILFGISPADPVAIIAAPAALAVVALAAAILPARRASRVDPMVSLRSE